jgi:hypothetical protein
MNHVSSRYGHGPASTPGGIASYSVFLGMERLFRLKPSRSDLADAARIAASAGDLRRPFGREDGIPPGEDL